jgi:hypothetical protein
LAEQQKRTAPFLSRTATATGGGTRFAIPPYGLLKPVRESKTWMAGTSPAMTNLSRQMLCALTWNELDSIMCIVLLIHPPKNVLYKTQR